MILLGHFLLAVFFVPAQIPESFGILNIREQKIYGKKSAKKIGNEKNFGIIVLVRLTKYEEQKNE